MLEFDELGYLMPYEPIPFTVESFTLAFGNSSPRRVRILKNYLDFVERLEQLGVLTYYQWIDGSFVTRKHSPKDLDIVTFVDYRTYTLHSPELHKLQERFEHKRLDLYFSIAHNPDDKYSDDAKDRQSRWLNLFSHDREGNPKGFLEIHF